jgi:beta-fructofuranosidase
MTRDEQVSVTAPDPLGLDEDLRQRAAHAVANRPSSVDADPWRQAFHIQPPVGLLNDPNGLVLHEGSYHLCYQWHPFAPRHAQKFWAHLTSPDLVHWTEHEPALTPSHPYDKDGCYSGSGVVQDGAVRFFYTGNVRGPKGERMSYQNVATLDPSGRVIRHSANPILAEMPACTAHVRDPKVWSRDGALWMVLGAQTDDLRGTILLLRSSDLVQWDLVGPITLDPEQLFGYMCECPDVVQLEGRDVLIVSPQFDHGERAGAERFTDETVYSPGILDLGAARFTGPAFRRVDAGPDFYAPQTFVDHAGRSIMVGWMGMPDHPGQPAIADKHPTVANGWVHCLTVPRELTLDGDALVAVPVRELNALHGDPVRVVGARVAPGTPLRPASGAALDIELLATCEPGTGLAVRLRDGDTGRPVVLTLDPGAGTATLDRTQLGNGEGGVSVGTFRPGAKVQARILLDHSSIEAFIDQGRLTMSARIYPPSDQGVTVEATGGAATLDLTVWPMNPA